MPHEWISDTFSSAVKATTDGFNSAVDATGDFVGSLAISKKFMGTDSGTEVIDSVSKAPIVLKFPEDSVSAGNFWTRLIINAWVPVKREEMSPKQNHGLDQFLLANIWLPMPLTLQTAYNQTYTEVEDMMVNRGTGINKDTLTADIANQVGVTVWHAGQEVSKLISSISTMNSSAKMNLGSVMNQNMGLVYDGATLRSHSFSWRMTPKNRDEQHRINQIVLALKGFASPVSKGFGGGDVTYATAKAAYQDTADAAKNLPKKGDAATAGIHGAKDTLRNIGRLAIPPTVNVEFWYGDKKNDNLFMVKDSFILSVDVNYTPTGTWNAYEDGAPIETQLNVVLKENAIITANDIDQVGGY